MAKGPKNMPLQISFDGAKLRKLRKAKGWTLMEMCDRVVKAGLVTKSTYLSPNSIRGWENNLQTPRYSAVVAFAAVFGVPLEHFAKKTRERKVAS